MFAQVVIKRGRLFETAPFGLTKAGLVAAQYDALNRHFIAQDHFAEVNT